MEMNKLKKSIFFALAYSFCTTSGSAAALGDQWYIGLGGGPSFLQPDPRQSGVDIDRRLSTGGNFFVGLDMDDRASGQLTLYALGDAELNNERLVAFQAFDGSVLYRLYDTKDARLRSSGMHLALYGRFALGFLNRDTKERLVNDSAVYFGAGGGAEWFINDTFSIRLDGMYHDKDATSGSLQLVGRFGGARRVLSRPQQGDDALIPSENSVESSSPKSPAVTTPVVPGAPVEPEEQNEPGEVIEQIEQVESVELIESAEPVEPIKPAEEIEPAELAGLIEPIELTDSDAATPSQDADPDADPDADQDGDNVPDIKDQCLGSRAGYPVRSTGCALFDGVLKGVNFVEGSSSLLPDATDQLDFLANVLVQYPQVQVELHSHTDNDGSVKDQTALTRERVRTIGAYLVRQGVGANRLVLRSFGGSRPLYDNENEEGRTGNNRVEVIESRN